MKGYDMKRISIAILLSGIICLFLTGCGSQSIDPADGAQDSWTNDSAVDSSKDSSSETSTLPYDDSICGLGGTVLAWDGAQPDVEKYNVKWRKSKDGKIYMHFVEGVGPGRFENGVYDCFQHSPIGAVMAAYFEYYDSLVHDILTDDYTLDEYTNIFRKSYRAFYSQSLMQHEDGITDQQIIGYAGRYYDEYLTTSTNSRVLYGAIGFSVIGYTGDTATIGILNVATDPTIYNLQVRNPDFVTSITYPLVWENNDWKETDCPKSEADYQFRYYKFWVPEII
jgi:hypothetical protein